MRTHVLLILALLAVGCDLKPPPQIASTPQPGTTAEPGLTVTGSARVEMLGREVVKDHGGIAIELSDGTRRFQATTDSKGVYGLSGIPAGRYTLQATREGHFPATASVSIGAESLQIDRITLSSHRVIVPDTTLAPGLYGASTNLVLSADDQTLFFLKDGAVKAVKTDGSGLSTEASLGVGSGERTNWFDRHPTTSSIVYAKASSTGHSLHVVGGSSPLATAQDPLSSPVWSPQGDRVAFMLEASGGFPATPSIEPFQDATDSIHVAIQSVAADGTGLQTHWRFSVSGGWNYGHPPIQWGSQGILFHKPMFCNLRHEWGDGLYVLRDFQSASRSVALQRLTNWSYYEHAWSPGGGTLFHVSGKVYRRPAGETFLDQKLEVGLDRQGADNLPTLIGMIPSSDGKRLYYLSGRGIEEMLLQR